MRYILISLILILSSITSLYAQTQTRPDTLTIEAGVTRRIQVFPGWNDENTGNVLYTGGESFFLNEVLFPEKSKLHADYSQNPGTQALNSRLVAYSVSINGIEDAFAMDYILVKYVESLEIPTLDPSSLPDSIRVGDEFTVTLKGDTDKMTSWVPTFLAQNGNIELINYTQSSATFRAIKVGNETLTLSHKNALRQDLDDSAIEITIYDPTNSVASFTVKVPQVYPNPMNDFGYMDIQLKQFETISLEIVDIMGNTKESFMVSGTQFHIPIHTHTYPAGIYFVRLTIKNASQTFRFVKVSS